MSEHIPPLKFLSGFSSVSLTRNIAERLGRPVAEARHEEFDDGEIRTELKGNIRGRDVVVIASAAGDPNTQEKETRLLMRSARETGAESVTLVLPYMFYGRSDSDFDARSTAGLADTIATFRDLCDQVVIIDPHNHGVTKRLFLEGRTKSAIPLHFAYPFAIQLKNLFNERVLSKDNLLLTYPDIGASKRVTRSFRECLYDVLDLDLSPEKSDEWAQVIASRDHNTGQKTVNINIDVSGKDVVMFEDMIASGGTACDVAKILKEKGANSVILFATSGLFTSKKEHGQRTTKAIDRINVSALDAVFITNTYSYENVEAHRHLFDAVQESPVIHVIDSSPYLSAVIRAMHMEVTEDMPEHENSISAILRGQHQSQKNGDHQEIPVTIKPNSPLRKLALG
jgi:ribose-phosphate pyrophosphokinase